MVNIRMVLCHIIFNHHIFFSDFQLADFHSAFNTKVTRFNTVYLWQQGFLTNIFQEKQFFSVLLLICDEVLINLMGVHVFGHERN